MGKVILEDAGTVAHEMLIAAMHAGRRWTVIVEDAGGYARTVSPVINGHELARLLRSVAEDVERRELAAADVMPPEHWMNVARTPPRKVAKGDRIHVQVEGGWRVMTAPCDGYEVSLPEGAEHETVFVPASLLAGGVSW